VAPHLVAEVDNASICSILLLETLGIALVNKPSDALLKLGADPEKQMHLPIEPKRRAGLSTNGADTAAPTQAFQLAYRTYQGRAFKGDSRLLLTSAEIEANSVDLLVMSPPYALTRKKDYGNESADSYVDWFMSFVEPFMRVLSPKGSLVIDIGGAYLPGRPQRSTYHFQLVVELAKQFELCQEFYWYNPAKLPSPAEWVNVRRIRVKDSVNPVVWFAKDAATTKANNRRVLKRYSESMEALLKNGYQYRVRPSGHDISAKFSKRHAGAIPPNVLGSAQAFDGDDAYLIGEEFEGLFPNLLAISNTSSNAHYQRECLAHKVKPHPARFPIGLPAFFIEFLTEPGDLVCDPFAGSNVTGEAAEALGRRWVSCDLDQDGGGHYVRASAFRFPHARLEPGFDHIPDGSYRTEARHTNGEMSDPKSAVATEEVLRR
jgi:site-specific DNA-methyltransferase (cytosine-N4-specific)